MDAKKHKQEIAELQAARNEDLAALREQVDEETWCQSGSQSMNSKKRGNKGVIAYRIPEKQNGII